MLFAVNFPGSPSPLISPAWIMCRCGARRYWTSEARTTRPLSADRRTRVPMTVFKAAWRRILLSLSTFLLVRPSVRLPPPLRPMQPFTLRPSSFFAFLHLRILTCLFLTSSSSSLFFLFLSFLKLPRLISFRISHPGRSVFKLDARDSQISEVFYLINRRRKEFFFFFIFADGESKSHQSEISDVGCQSVQSRSNSEFSRLPLDFGNLVIVFCAACSLIQELWKNDHFRRQNMVPFICLVWSHELDDQITSR